MYNSQETSTRIKKLAKEKGIQMIELQELCGLNKNAVAQAGKSQEGMKAKNLYAIAEMLECSVDYLLGRTNDENGSSNYVNGNNSVQAVQNDNCEITLNVNNSTNDELMEIKTILDSLSVRDRHELLNMIFGYADTHVSKNSNLKMEGE